MTRRDKREVGLSPPSGRRHPSHPDASMPCEVCTLCRLRSFTAGVALAQTVALRRDLDQLVLADELDGFLQRHPARRHRLIEVVRRGGAHVGELLLLCNVYAQVGPAEKVFRLRGLTPDAAYTISQDGRVIRQATGAKLAEGVPVALEDEWRAAVLEIEREP